MHSLLILIFKSLNYVESESQNYYSYLNTYSWWVISYIRKYSIARVYNNINEINNF